MYYRGLLNSSLLAIWLGKFSAIHGCSADKPQTKKWGDEAQYFIKMESKYSPIYIQFSYLNFKNFHPHVQNNVRNCVQHKQKKKQQKTKQNKTKKKKPRKGGGGMGEKYNGLLTHFICRVNKIMSMFTWVWDHGYRYGYNAMGMGTSPACQEVTGTGPRPYPYPWVQVQTFASG